MTVPFSQKQNLSHETADDVRTHEPVGFETTVVIPVYFNERSVALVVESVMHAWQQSGRDLQQLEFVLVDDGSRDNSWQVLQDLARHARGRITALRLVQNHGSQLATLAGCSMARGRRIAAIAADGQEPADLVARMAAAADKGARLILAVRSSRADDWGTRAGASFFYRLMRLLGLKKMPRAGFDAFMMDREILETILEMRDPNIPLAVTIAWLGYPFAEVRYDRLQRLEGRSRWTLRKKIKLALDAITSVSYAPIRAISLFGVVVALCGFAWATFVIFERIFFGIPVQGWASLLVAVLFIGGTQLISLGVIGEYLWRTFEVARRRPLWRIAEVERADIQTPNDIAGERTTKFVSVAARNRHAPNDNRRCEEAT
jgi:glycosyltransferase involved in cell wall biosynthesis